PEVRARDKKRNEGLVLLGLKGLGESGAAPNQNQASSRHPSLAIVIQSERRRLGNHSVKTQARARGPHKSLCLTPTGSAAIPAQLGAENKIVQKGHLGSALSNLLASGLEALHLEPRDCPSASDEIRIVSRWFVSCPRTHWRAERSRR